MRLLLMAIILIPLLILQGCASFKPLPNNVKKISEINGIYFNDYDTIRNKSYGKLKLWNFVDKNYKAYEDGLLVKIEITTDNKIKAQLIKQNKIIAEKLVKGKMTNDYSYYRHRVFYIVPILPILWWYMNDQLRFYYFDNHLVVDWTYNRGGAAIIMAGGDKQNLQWYFNRLNK